MLINNCPTLEKHFFVIGEDGSKKLIASEDKTCHIVAQCEIEEDFEQSFCLSKKDFDIAKKLKNRKFVVDGNKIVISSGDYEYVTTSLEMVDIPTLSTEDVRFGNTYFTRVLKDACKFTMNNPSEYSSLNGVLISESGDVIASDKIKFYFHLNDTGVVATNDKFVSVPKNLMDFLNDEHSRTYLEVLKTKVRYKANDLIVQLSLFDSKIPNFAPVLNSAHSGTEYKVALNDGLNLFTEADVLDALIDTENNYKFVLSNREKGNTLVIQSKELKENKVGFKVSYKDFMLAKNINGTNEMTIRLNNLVCVDNHIILLPCKA